MCGIAGIIAKDSSDSSLSELRLMLKTLEHRGPDAEGIFTEGGVHLGHRRLSIIDLSTEANQPMHYKNYVIVFNGEIYNYIELRKELQKEGHHFITQSDTEVILHSFEEWGEGCLEYFRGMWAFAILDKDMQRIFLARDRFGIKPLYYLNAKNNFIFASEIKAIVANRKRKVKYDILLTYLALGLEDYSSETSFADIKQLLPGERGILDLKTQKWQTEIYYYLDSTRRSSVDNPEYSTILQGAVRLHLRSDVPVGTCLSGGIDSSIIAALAARIKITFNSSKFIAVTAQSESAHNDESRYAQEVIKYCGMDSCLTKPTYQEFSRNIEKCLYMLDEPVGGPSVFMQYAVMQAAHQAGLKVLLDGQGGDETLLGYERYFPSFFKEMALQGHWLTLFREFFLAMRNSGLSSAILFAYTFYFLSISLRKTLMVKRFGFLKSEFLQFPLKVMKEWFCGIENLRDLQISEISRFQLPHLLRYEDRNSMAHSIEARVPYVDHCCVERALLIEAREKIKDGYTKYPLRELASTILPTSIAWRKKKIGFEAPEQIWFQQHCGKMQQEVINSTILKKICAQIPNLRKTTFDIAWRLYNIAVWERIYNIEI